MSHVHLLNSDWFYGHMMERREKCNVVLTQTQNIWFLSFGPIVFMLVYYKTTKPTWGHTCWQVTHWLDGFNGVIKHHQLYMDPQRKNLILVTESRTLVFSTSIFVSSGVSYSNIKAVLLWSRFVKHFVLDLINCLTWDSLSANMRQRLKKLHEQSLKWQDCQDRLLWGFWWRGAVASCMDEQDWRTSMSRQRARKGIFVLQVCWVEPASSLSYSVLKCIKCLKSQWFLCTSCPSFTMCPSHQACTTCLHSVHKAMLSAEVLQLLLHAALHLNQWRSFCAAAARNTPAASRH